MKSHARHIPTPAQLERLQRARAEHWSDPANVCRIAATRRAGDKLRREHARVARLLQIRGKATA